MTYVVKHRGPTRAVPKEFCCPVHGDFTADADRDAESAPCPAVFAPPSESTLRVFRGALGLPPGGLDPSNRPSPVVCGEPSPWTPRKVPAIRMRRIEAVRGKPEAAEHKGWLDTSNLEEGQDPEEFAADREKVHEELRKELVTEMVRTDR